MSKIKRTEEEIAAEITWLKENKPRIPRITLFGDNNWEAIDAQVRVLEEKMCEDCAADEFEFESGHTISYALQAAWWLGGEDEQIPSAKYNWGGLVKK